MPSYLNGLIFKIIHNSIILASILVISMHFTFGCQMKCYLAKKVWNCAILKFGTINNISIFSLSRTNCNAVSFLSITQKLLCGDVAVDIVYDSNYLLKENEAIQGLPFWGSFWRNLANLRKKMNWLGKHN